MLQYLFCRWTRGSGNPVMESYNNWYSGEPDLKEFDYEKRKFTPLKNSLVSACTSTPAYDCYESTDTRCQNRCVAPLAKTACKGCGCNSKRKCKSSNNPLFVDLRTILESTEEGLPACMAMYGPQLQSSLIMAQQGNGNAVSNFGVEECSQLFETGVTQTDPTQLDQHYLKWSDLKCNEKTRAQICTLLGS